MSQVHRLVRNEVMLKNNIIFFIVMTFKKDAIQEEVIEKGSKSSREVIGSYLFRQQTKLYLLLMVNFSGRDAN